MGKSRNRCLLEAAMRFRREYKVISITSTNKGGERNIKSFVRKRVD